MADLIKVTVDSSFSPEITVTEGDVLPGGLATLLQALSGERAAAPGDGSGGEGVPPGPLSTLARFFKGIALSIVRPRVHVQSDLFGADKTIATYGDPFPWWIGLPVLILLIGALSAWIYAKVRRAVK